MPFPWKGLRDYLADQEALGDVLRIKKPIKCGDPKSIVDTGWVGKTCESELRILMRYLQSLPNNPIAIIENPICNRPDIPVVINLYGNAVRTMRAHGCATREEQINKIIELEKRLIPPVKLDKAKAPCKQVVIPANKIDLERDLPRIWVEFENHSWFTYGNTIMRDEKSGNHNIATWRYGFFDWEEGDPSRPQPEERRKRHAFGTIFWRTARATRGGLGYEKYRREGKPMPVAVAYGVEPGTYAIGIPRIPWPKYDEYDIAGGFRGEPVEVVEAETIPGLMVPAHAEWIFEGELLPEDYKVSEGAEAVWHGYMVGGELAPILKINCITHRKNPIWPITWSMKIWGDHATFANPLYEGEAIRNLRELEFRVKDAAIYDATCMVIQSELDGAEKNDFPHYGKLMGAGLYGGRSRHASGKTLKFIIVVGPEVNPHNPREVLWALNTRFQPVTDSVFFPHGVASWGDPSANTGLLGWKAFGEQQIMDALIKIPERTTWYPPVSEPKEWEEKNLPKIKAKIEKP